MPEQDTLGEYKGIQINTPELQSILRTLNADQRRYIAHRLTTSTDVEAAQLAGIPPNTVRTWRNRHDVKRAIQLITDSTLDAVIDMRRLLLVKALNVMEKALDSNDERIRVQAAIDIQDRTEGKATQRISPINPDGTAYTPNTTTTQEQDERMLARIEELARIARARRLEASKEQIEAHIEVIDTTATELPIEQAK